MKKERRNKYEERKGGRNKYEERGNLRTPSNSYWLAPYSWQLAEPHLILRISKASTPNT
jgi:hypothetical protein